MTVEETFKRGRARHQAGALAEAEAAYRSALVLAPDHQDTLKHLGVLLFSTSRYAEAADVLAKLSQAAPDSAEAQNNLANALVALGKHDEAIAAYERALALDPNLKAARSNLASLHVNRGLPLVHTRHAQAAQHFARAIAVDPDRASAHAALGFSLHALGKPEEALASFRRALGIEPDNTEALRGFGIAAQALGQSDEARRALERAVALAPTNPSYHRVLSQMKRFIPGDPQIATMESLANDPSRLPEPQQAELHYALGKAYRDIGETRAAIEHLLRANTIRRRTVQYDEAGTLGMMHRIAAVFTPELLAEKGGAGDDSSLPIFIVGMPRSGTTLVEQILASHPLVTGGGERTLLSEIARSLTMGNVVFPESVTLLEAKSLGQAGRRYVNALQAEAPGASRITDKMPMNFELVGLIHLALPKARIIHVIRDPVDTCMSCFTRTFGRNLPFSYGLGELGRYYRAYVELMSHWRSVLPAGRMLEMRYGDVVGDLESAARQMIAYCGLKWDERCVAFHRTQRPILTASATEVRQPLYADAIGRWKDCGDLLAPLVEALGPLAAR